MIVATDILGQTTDGAFAGRAIDAFRVTSRDAERRRLRGTTTSGADIRVDLAVPEYLRHGAVLHDDGSVVVAVERELEEAVVVRLDPHRSVGDLVAAGVRIGHALGNQHVPVEVHGTMLYVPITTSSRLALDTVSTIATEAATVTLERVRLGSERPLWAGGPPHAGQGHGHDHGRR